MKIIKIIILALNFLYVSTYRLKDVEKENLLKVLKKYQVGLFDKVPNGPLTGEQAEKAMDDEWERKNGIKKNEEVGVVYISENLRNKRLGKFRIKGEGIHLHFPTDTNTKYFQDFRDNENFKQLMQKKRIKFEKNKINEAQTDFKKNPFKEIIEGEKKLIDYGIYQVKKDHQKNLMEKAIEKEEEIYNNMVKNELSKVHAKRYNK